MKTKTPGLIILGIVSGLTGWFAAGTLDSNKPAPDAKEAADASLIARRSTVPEAITALKSGGGKSDFRAISDFMLRLETASVADCRRWLELLMGNDSPESRELRLAIIDRWAELDPAGALEAVRANADQLAHLARRVLRQWAESDLETALDATLAGTQKTDIYAIMEGAGSEQIERLYELLIERGFDRTNGPFFSQIFRYLSATDVNRAASLALKFELSNPSSSAFGLDNVLGVWIRDGPDAALQWVESIEAASERERAMASLAKKWIEQDPLEGLKAMWGRIPFQKSFSGISTGSMNDEEFTGLVAWINEQKGDSPDEVSQVARAILSRLSGNHPERLSQVVPLIHLEDVVALQSLPGNVLNAASEWAARDETAVLEFIDSTANAAIQEAAIRGLVNHWSQKDPARALEFLNSLGKPIKFISTRPLLENLFEQNNDLGAVFAQIPESMRDQSYLDYVNLTDLTGNDPAGILEFLERQPQGLNRDRAMQITVGNLAREDPEAAAAWVAAQSEGDARLFGAANVANAWARFDADAAASWARSLPDEPSRSRALVEIANTIAPNRPAEAVELALGIPDEATRAKALPASLEALARRDPDAALGMLGKAGVSDEIAARVTSAANEARALRVGLPDAEE